MKFAARAINRGCFVIDNVDQGTVAMVTPQGAIDWMVISSDDRGTFIEEISVETHLSKTHGLKIELIMPWHTEVITEIRHELLDGGERIRLFCRSVNGEGHFEAETSAVLSVNPKTRRYEWSLETVGKCTALEDVPLHENFLQFNNIYPGTAGRCMLFTPQKEYDATVMMDKDGVPWRFPHQHILHYRHKIAALTFSEGAMAGFFGEDYNPVVIVDSSTTPLSWGICDMYFDLHCNALLPGPAKPGETYRWAYRVLYLDRTEAEPIERAARALPMTAEDYRKHNFPRLALGQNDFKEALGIDTSDDASAFRTEPPKKTWDKATGLRGGGSLRLCNETAEETAWDGRPPTMVPPGTKLRLTGMVKTQGVSGKGIFLRMLPHRFFWTPKPHVDWAPPLESTAVSGTSDWVRVETPVFETPADIPDQLVWIAVVLDGIGTAWLTDVGVELANVEVEVPAPVFT
ncbi:MAG: hypothetical protein FWF84_05420 [Kiritimatiellaeota bacterium]|nr:hypothetical protein [Kiritimatiellota bacterium]